MDSMTKDKRDALEAEIIKAIDHASTTNGQPDQCLKIAVELLKTVLALTDNTPRWSTIDSAPRDGTRILLWWKGATNPVSGYYDTEPSITLEEGFGCHGDYCIPTNQEIFTHWQRLPAAPEGDE